MTPTQVKDPPTSVTWPCEDKSQKTKKKTGKTNKTVLRQLKKAMSVYCCD